MSDTALPALAASPVAVDPSEVISEAHRLYADALFRHCYFRRFTKEESEEIVQEAFMKTWQYLEKGNEIKNLKVFLYRVVNNLIVDTVRKRKENEVSLDALMELGIDVGTDKTESLQQKLDTRQVLHVLKKKEKSEHDLLMMRFGQGLMPADIAVKTGVSANTVSVRLHRALKKFTSYLAHG